MDYNLAVECYEPEGVLECGETISCALGPDGGRGQDATGFRGPGFFYDVFGFTGSQGQQVNVSMTTPDSEDRAAEDPYLYLLGPKGSVVAEDDDSGFGYGALIRTALPADGAYTVMATSRAPGQQFEYDISLDCPELEPDPIECRQTLSGELTRGDPSGFRGPEFRQDTYIFRAGAGDYVTPSLATPPSENGDPYLYLLGPNGSIVAKDDDNGPGSGGGFTHRIPEDGEYTVVATSRTPRSFFPYEISLECGGGFGVPLHCEGTLTCRSVVSGELGPGDETGFRGSNYFHDVYCFEGTELDTNAVYLSIERSADPRVYIVGPDGNVLAEGDTIAANYDDPVPDGDIGRIVVTGRSEKGPVEYELEYRCVGLK